MNGKLLQMPKWTTGVITTPREHGYFLDKTLRSMQGAGLPSPVIFAEPNSPIPDEFQGDVVFRRKQYGDWTNWASGLYELFLSEPETDYFLMVEDDCLFCKNLVEYLEYAIPLLPEFAYISLYTGNKFHRPKIRGFHNEARGWDTWSTVAILLEHKRIENFLGNIDVMRHRKESLGSIHDNTSKDCVMGRWAKTLNLPIYYHSPSLTEHIGWDSTLLWSVNKGYTDDDYPHSEDFVGEYFDASQWVGEPPDIRNNRAITL